MKYDFYKSPFLRVSIKIDEGRMRVITSRPASIIMRKNIGKILSIFEGEKPAKIDPDQAYLFDLATPCSEPGF